MWCLPDFWLHFYLQKKEEELKEKKYSPKIFSKNPF